MGRPRPPGSHCRFGQGIELVRYLDCRAIRLLCQGDHLPSARLTLGPGSFRDGAMAPTIAHLFDEYHSLKSEVFGPKGDHSCRASTAKTVPWVGLMFLSCAQRLYSAHPSTTPYDAPRRPTLPCTSLRFPTFPFLRPKTCPKQRPTIPHDSLQMCYTR